MTDLSDAALEAMAGKLTPAQKRALLSLTDTRQYPSRDTFTAGAAWSLSWTSPQLAQRVNVLTATSRSHKYRDAYFLTPLGLALRTYLRSKDTSK